MLKRPEALAKLVSILSSQLSIPITVKIRLGISEYKINAQEVAKRLEEAGAAAVIIHGRTMEQRYT
jgi:tRNA-dihydrouridine synthase 3